MLLAGLTATPAAHGAPTATYTAKVRGDAYLDAFQIGPDGRHHVLSRPSVGAGIDYSVEENGVWKTTELHSGEFGDVALTETGEPLLAVSGFRTETGPVRIATLQGGEWQYENVKAGEMQRPLQKIRVAVASDGDVHLAYSYKFSDGLVYRTRIAGVWSDEEVIDPVGLPVGATVRWDMLLDTEDVPHFVVSGLTPSPSPGDPCVIDGGCTVDIIPNGSTWTVTPLSTATGIPEAIYTATHGLEMALNDDVTIRYVGRVGSAWVTQSVVTANASASLARGPDGPVIFYAGSVVGLGRADRFGSSWTTTAIASGNFGHAVGMLDEQGRPHIGYWRLVRDSQGIDHIDSFMRAPDDVPPTVGIPGIRPKSKATISSTIPMSVLWSAADAQSGVSHYRLQQKIDAGGWSTVSSNLTTTSATRNLVTGHTYQFRVAGYDKAGKATSWRTSLPARISRYSENSSLIRYSGSWSSSRSSTADGGRTRFTTSAAGKATIRFTGTGFAWIAPMSATHGPALVVVDGNVSYEVNTYKATAAPRTVVLSIRWSAPGTHTVEIQNRPGSARKRIDIDSILIVR